jgi:cobalt-zinc-cadmium efflux system membrane fusion protein
MLASFTIEIDGSKLSIGVPSDAVVREGDGTMTVWVTSDRHRFERRIVKVGIAQDGWSQILDGLEVGELIASTGAIFLSNKLATATTG